MSADQGNQTACECWVCEGEGCTYGVYGQLDTYVACRRCNGTGQLVLRDGFWEPAPDEESER